MQPGEASVEKVTKRTTGLIGLFGHTYVPDEDNPGNKTIEYQFQIIRRVPLIDGWCSYSSLRTGDLVKVYSESFLLGDDAKPYTDME
jgi:hypothetical protein